MDADVPAADVGATAAGCVANVRGSEDFLAGGGDFLAD
jgi:hypothetical protein